MSSDENQQALAWQQIIKNRAFDNVKMRGDESWVDAACRTLDELIDKPYPEDETPKVAWRWRERALEAERYLMEARRELDEEKSRSQLFAARADKANGERDAEASRADYLNKKFAKLMFDYQDVEDERDEWKDRAEAAETRTVPAVTKAEIEKAIRGEDLFERQIDAVWSLVSGSDAAVFDVRESDLAAVEVKRNAEGDWWTENRGCGQGATADGMRQMAEILIRDAIEYEAIARAIEAKQAVDPVEAKAAEFYDLAGRVGDDIWAACRNIAAHVLGQEGRYVDQ